MSHQPLPVPLYQRIFGVLHQRIRSGGYLPGHQLPTEQELAAEFGVSKGTIRQALGVLADRGLILRKQGSGTFVTETGSHEVFVGSFADLIVGTKDLPLRDLRLEDDVPFPLDVREALETSQTRGKVIRRRREVDGQIFAYSIQYLSPAIADIVTERELREYGFLDLLNNHGIALKFADQSVTAQLADVEAAERLEIELGSPVLFARRVLHSSRGPAEVVHGWYRGDLYQWRSRLALRHSNGKLSISSPS